MSSRYSQVRIAMDLFNETPEIAPAGQEGDRFEMFISFEGDLPVPVPGFKTAPRVIITPVRKSRLNGAGNLNLATPIVAARDITVQGFRLNTFNQDPDSAGRMGFHWLAIEESPGSTNPVPKLTTGVLPPLHYAPFREGFPGNRSYRDHCFAGSGMFDTSVSWVQLTSSDSGVQGHSVPAAGQVYDPEDARSDREMHGHNVDIVAGDCAFNWATFSQTDRFDPASTGGTPEPTIETGGVDEAWFEPAGHAGDWHTWNLAFNSRFSHAPLVFLTATRAADIPIRLNAAVVGVAQAVTTSGFRLAARSCDSHPGLSGFNWLAIGPVK